MPIDNFILFAVSLIIAGCFVGFASGLLGIGGGFIMIPVQFWGLTLLGVDSTLAIRVAFGTNLLVIIPTAAISAFSHNRKKSVVWEIALFMAVTGIFGAYLGGIIATHIPGSYLRSIFGIFSICISIRMLCSASFTVDEIPESSRKKYMFWGFPTGLLAGTLGVGGGGLSIPILVFKLRLSIHKALGTSSALMIFISSGAALSFFINGLSAEVPVPYTIGYISWLQAGLLAVGSIPLAIIGVRVAHRLNAIWIRNIFAVFVMASGLKMSGIFPIIEELINLI